MSQKSIHVAAVVLLDSRRRVLTVRKRGTERFMQPGGKPEPDEGPRRTALREIAEEIGLHLQPAQLQPMGRFRAAAANESGYDVVCENYLVDMAQLPAEPSLGEEILAQLQPAAEIEELRWIPLDQLRPSDDLAPLLTEQVAPAVRRILAAEGRS
ncbi:NUDIX domain-containing protein [Nesterenkonia sp.]|uniref:NUDIX hydrolase n=1 Tax=Nesterenkonia sp. TaxID=704201 RepID=UPI0026147125|nr:NUDIX domain-containing protein [Nesterenkonia sp.]